jgi:hypothetical protein
MCNDMGRKVATAILVVALLLTGFQSLNAAMGVPVMAVGMASEQPCCPDCDQPAVPDLGCAAMAGCMTAATSWTVPTALSVLASYAPKLLQPFPNRSPLAAADVLPPFRPPRFSILA